MKLVTLDARLGTLVPATEYSEDGKMLNALQHALVGFNATEEEKAEWPITLCSIGGDYRLMMEQICDLAEQGEAVFMTSFNSANDWTDMGNAWWHAATSFPRVRHQQLPDRNPGLDGMRNLARKAIDSSNANRWELPLRLARLGSVGDGAINALRHIQGRALADPASGYYQRWLKGTKALFGNLSDTELAAAVDEAESPTPFAGEHFQIVALDCEGTVLDEEGNLRETVLAHASEVAATAGLPIVLWTGGELDKIQRKLRNFRHEGTLPFLLAEKGAFRGASVEIALDDLSHEVFARTYDVGVTTYVQV